MIGLQECLGIASGGVGRQAFIWMAVDILVLTDIDYMVFGSNLKSFWDKKASAHEK